MLWYGFGWWWWWLLFVVIFFLLPVGYGWGYRGWGPWYRRRRWVSDEYSERWSDDGWGWGGVILWIILILAIIWLIFAWGWGTTAR